MFYRRNFRLNSQLSESSLLQLQHDGVGTIDVGHDDTASVLTASEVVFAVSRINYYSREFRVGVTFSVVCNSNELEWSGQERIWR